MDPVNLAANRVLEQRMLTAADAGDAGTVRKLLKKFVSPNVRDEAGVSALSKAARGKDLLKSRPCLSVPPLSE